MPPTKTLMRTSSANCRQFSLSPSLVVEPAGFKATGFALKFDVEDTSGKVSTSTLNFNSNQRSYEAGGIASPGNLRSLTVTITATFKDNANTTVLTREDKKTQPFILKQVVKPE